MFNSVKIFQLIQPIRTFSFSSTLRQHINTHKPTELEKKFLVWTGKYKSVAEVPSHVNNEVMERCRNRIRIRVANIMMVLTAVGCIGMVISGKQAMDRGETVSKKNIDWHKKYNEMQKKEGSE